MASEPASNLLLAVHAEASSRRVAIERLAGKGVIAFPLSVEKATAGRPSVEYGWAFGMPLR